MDECFQVERLVLHGANSEFFNFRAAKYEKRGVLFVAQTHTNVLNVDSAPEVERVGHRLTETFEKDTFPLWYFPLRRIATYNQRVGQTLLAGQ